MSTDDHVKVSNGYDNKSLTLKEATEFFIGGALDGDDPFAPGIDPMKAKAALTMMRAFQEGAFWACWRIHHEHYQEKPHIFGVVCNILEHHAAVRDLVKAQTRPN